MASAVYAAAVWLGTPTSDGIQTAVVRFAAIVVGLVCVLGIVACGGGGGVSVTQLKRSDKPYFWLGTSFDGLNLTHAEPYGTGHDRGVADLIYGDCHASGDAGCAPPLDLQHRLCRGTLTIVIFVGTDPTPGRAARAAKALRPLTNAARRITPQIAYDRSPPC